MKDIEDKNVQGLSATIQYNTSVLTCRYIIDILSEKIQPIEMAKNKSTLNFLNMIEAVGYIKTIFEAVNVI